LDRNFTLPQFFTFSLFIISLRTFETYLGDCTFEKLICDLWEEIMLILFFHGDFSRMKKLCNYDQQIHSDYAPNRLIIDYLYAQVIIIGQFWVVILNFIIFFHLYCFQNFNRSNLPTFFSMDIRIRCYFPNLL
jgi:hypothetical protein